MSEIAPTTILSQIIKPEYQKYFGDWITTANEKEARGLQLIGAIYKHKGRKKFRAKPPSVQLKTLHEQNEFDLKKAEEMYRKNQTTSSYAAEFGYLSKDLKPQNNVFKYKKCSELEFSQPLNQLAKLFIDNWIDLKDDLEFQDLVLDCLRSLHSRVKAQEVPRSETKQRFAFTNVDWKLCKPFRIDKAGADLKYFCCFLNIFKNANREYKTNYNAIFKQRLKEEQMNEKFKELEEKMGKDTLDLIVKKSFKI